MKVILGNYGFCSGVNRAVNLAKNAQKEYGKVYTLGKLIHNEDFVSELKNQGIIPISHNEEIKNSVVIIRSHGVAKAIYEGLVDNGNKIIDATCPSVKKIHERVFEYSTKGYKIIIFGNENHAEVIGTAGWCNCPIITDNVNCKDLLFSSDKYYVVAQTTASIDKYNIFKKNLQYILKNKQKTVEFFDSICYTTSCRRIVGIKIAKKCDCVLVIGDKTSSNTLELFNLAKQYCKNTYFISNVSDVQSVSDIKNITMLGLLAGASTPERLIMEVINRMDQENKVGTIEKEVATTTNDVAAKEVAVEVANVAPAKETTSAPADASAKKEVMTMAEGMKKYGVRTYHVGMKCKATIESVDPTGVSVSVHGLGKNDSGFISASEMELDGSFEPANYKIGDELDVVIIEKTDIKNKSINLSKKLFDAIKVEDGAVKQILEGKEFTLACNQAVKGGLLGRLGTYTIFVPASQIRSGFVKNLDEYVGKKLRLRILPPKEEAEGEEDNHRKPNPKRILASQRIILEEEKANKEKEFWDNMQVNYIVKGKVKRFTDYAAFVSVMGFDCFAHISDLSWTKINNPGEVLEINKTYDFLVIKVDRESKRVSLGYKQLQKKPYELAAEKYHVGDVITGKVERIKDFGAFIEIEPGIDGLVHVSEIRHEWIKSASEALKIGDEIQAKIIGFENNKITLSMKALIEAPVVEEVPEDVVAEGEATAEEASAKSNRISKFKNRAEASQDAKADKKGRTRRDAKSEDDGEPHEYVSEGSINPTFGDLFKNIDIKFEEDNK